MSKKYWGEIPPKKKHDQAVTNIMADIEKCMDQFCLAEYQDESDIELTENIVFVDEFTVFMYLVSTVFFVVYPQWIQ